MVGAKNDGEKEQDPTLAETLASEDNKSKILNWIIEGMQMYYFGIDEENTPESVLKNNGIYSDARKLKLPDSIELQQNKLMASGSAPLRWLLDQEEEGILTVEAHRPLGSPPIQANAYLDISEAYRMFQLWCAENGERNITAKRFFEDDLSGKFEVVRYSGKKKFKGLLKTNAFQVNPLNSVSVSDNSVLIDPAEHVDVPAVVGNPMPDFAFPPDSRLI